VNTVRHQVVAVTEREEYARWLKDALENKAEVAVADSDAVERVLQLVDATSTDIVFVQFDEVNLRAQTALVEGLFAVKPYLSVVAVSDTYRRDVLLAAMRASVRDFIAFDSDPLEIQDLLERLLEQAPRNGELRRQGKLFAFLCGLPGPETATLAVHTALVLQEIAGAEERVLLVDLGVPTNVSRLFLDLKPSYTFVDAMRSVRRFDETLIQTAFAQHVSGLTLLPMPEDTLERQELTAVDAVILLNVLKSYFHSIVVNVGGLDPADLLHKTLGKADHVTLLAEQSVLSCNANKKLLDFLAARDFPVSTIGLIVDRYSQKLGLDARDVADLLGLPLLGTLPPNGIVRLNAINTGHSIFELAPRDSYARAVRAVTEKLAKQRFGGATDQGLWSKMLRGLRRERAV
jgi:pilus assembly protein CpaE